MWSYDESLHLYTEIWIQQENTRLVRRSMLCRGPSVTSWSNNIMTTNAWLSIWNLTLRCHGAAYKWNFSLQLHVSWSSCFSLSVRMQSHPYLPCRVGLMWKPSFSMQDFLFSNRGTDYISSIVDFVCGNTFLRVCRWLSEKTKRKMLDRYAWMMMHMNSKEILNISGPRYFKSKC